MKGSLAHLVLGVLLVLWPATVLGQAQANVPVRTMSVSFSRVPTLGFSARDFLDAAVAQKLQSGLPQTVSTRVYAYAEHGREPLALSAISCRIIFDLWEGTYRIERQSEHGDRTLSAKSLDAVMQLCLDVPKLVLGKELSFEAERGKRIYFGVLVELNPMSQDTVQRIRRWLARPGGNQLEGKAFFGSFVSIFVTRKMGGADKTLSFRSELFSVPP